MHSSCLRSGLEVVFEEAPKCSVPVPEFFVAALLDEPALVEDEDLVGLGDGVEVVGDDEYAA